MLNVCNLSIPTYITGYQNPRTANGMLGLALYASPPNFGFSREYVSTSLMFPMQDGQRYCVSIYVNNANNVRHAIDQMGVHFSLNPITWSLNTELPFSPSLNLTNGTFITDTLGWTNLQYIYMADSNYNYMTLGNFYDDVSTNLLLINSNATNDIVYLNIDDISVTLIRPIYMTPDEYFCVDSVLVGDTLEGMAVYSWSPTNGLACDTCYQTLATPLVTTTYTLTKTTACDTNIAQVTVYVDSVHCDSIVSVESLNFPLSNFKLYPNPNNGDFTFEYELVNNANLIIYSITGKKVAEYKLLPSNKSLLINEKLNNGIYLYKVIEKGNGIKMGKFTVIN